MKKKKKLIEIFPDWIENGIFNRLEAYDVPWKDIVDAESLDIDYFGNRSGGKHCSMLIERMLVDDTLSEEKKNLLAKLIFQKYGHAWTRAFQALMKDYNPIENYNKTELELINGQSTNNSTHNGEYSGKSGGSEQEKTSIDGTNTLQRNNSVNVSDTENRSLNQTNTANNTVKNGIYGFDSPASSGSDDSIIQENEGVNETSNNTRVYENTENGTNTETVDTETNVEHTRDLTNEGTTKNITNGSNKNEVNRNLTVSGNIGVTTNQEMVKSELMLRFDWKYFDLIYSDVDNVLATNVFEIFQDEEQRCFYNII